MQKLIHKLTHRRPSGQAIIIVALAMVGLLAMVALAVDGSMLMADRRGMQSAADNAALTGASAAAGMLDSYGVQHQDFLCQKPTSPPPPPIDPPVSMLAAYDAAFNAAIASALQEGYVIGRGIVDENGVEITCFVQYDPSTGQVERHLDVTVKIAGITATGFAQIVKPEGLSQTVSATARVWPRRSLTGGNAIASLNDACPGIYAGGSSAINVRGGGIFSNSCLELEGSMDVTINVDMGGIGYLDSVTIKNAVDITPAGTSVNQATEKLPIIPINTPNCLGLTDYGNIDVAGTQTINPGRYGTITMNGTDHLILTPGLYCLSGTFSTGGGQTVEVDPTRPDEEGVTFYMVSGNIDFSGNSTIILKAPSINMDPALKGMLIYFPPSNCGSATLTGTAGSSFRGTVYAPCGDIIVTGDADIPFATELVGGSVTVWGNAKIDITDDDAFNFTRSPMIELVQ